MDHESGIPDPADTGWSGGVEIANEFTSVRLRVVDTVTGTRVEILSTRLGSSILLDPIELESLTWQTSDTFSSFLSTPLGPAG